MKRIILFLLLLAFFADARDFLNQFNCNDGIKRDYDNNGIPRHRNPGIPETSCFIETGAISIGANFMIGGYSSFFLDQEIYFKTNANAPEYPIRFVVYSDEKNYNMVQALVQTAYATRARVELIFVNPKYKILSTDSHLSDQTCFSNNDSSGKMVSINCPIQSIRLLQD